MGPFNSPLPEEQGPPSSEDPSGENSKDSSASEEPGDSEDSGGPSDSEDPGSSGDSGESSDSEDPGSPEDADDTDSSEDSDEPKAPPPLPPAPVLLGAPAIKYDPSSGKVSVGFSFNMAVQTGGMDGWTVTGDGTAAITTVPATDPVPGKPLTAALTAANPDAPDRAVKVPVTVIPVEAAFTRAAMNGNYKVEYADQNGAVRVQPAAGGPKWYYLPDEGLRKLFTAVYSPNAPGTLDDVEQGFAAVHYDGEISERVLKLFTITVGPSSADDRIEISGMDLPSGTDRYHPVVIDAGIPEGDNSGLTFTVPAGKLGAAGRSYSHIRLRANRGAYLVIEGDSNHLATGNLTKGTVEVMGGGKLRNGAYQGSPLGAGAITLVRLGSFFATGPEKSFESSRPGYVDSVDKFYSGWLIGPAAGNPRIQWGVGDQNGDYFEIRSEGIAFSANITVKKTLILDAGLWFINGPTLTIDAAGDGLTHDGKKGLFAAANGDYRFYGTKSQSGGQNIADVMAKLVIQSGSSLHRSFLTDEQFGDDKKFITAAGGGLTINNQGDTAERIYYAEGDSRHGCNNWLIP